MDNIALAFLVVGTLGLVYVLLFQIAALAGDRYPAAVTLPATVAALAVGLAGIVQFLWDIGTIPQRLFSSIFVFVACLVFAIAILKVARIIKASRSTTNDSH